MTQISLPTVSNDTGDGTSGTIFNEAYWTSVGAAVDALIHSATNPAITPADIIDEVVTARGSLGSVDARIDVEHNNDGTHNLPPTYATIADLQSAFNSTNWLANDTFYIWHEGAAAAPTGWTLSGAGASVARETSTIKVGPNAVKVTRAGADSSLTYATFDSGAYQDTLDGHVLSFGAWVYCSIASFARLQIDDGASTSESSYHTGDGTWQWLALTHTISGSATKIDVVLHANGSNGDGIYAGVTLVHSDTELAQWIPCQKVYGQWTWEFIGTPVTGDGQRIFMPARPLIIKDIQAYAKTAPGGGNNLTIDIERWDGAAWQSIFSGAKNIIVTTANAGGVQPDGTYQYRCTTGLFGATLGDNIYRLNLDAVGSAVDIAISVRALQWTPPIEDFLAFDDI